MFEMKNSAKTAKLNRQLFFEIAKGVRDISSNAINFMLFTINYVAKDGRIYCEKDTICNGLYLQNKTLNRVIKELTELNLLSEKDGFLYSHFHVLSNGEKEDKGYIRNIKVLTSEEILSLSKTKKRFFLYVASFARIGVPKKVSVEALYSNKYHSGVNYIESYQELAEILFDFVQKGLFVVYINGKRYDNQSPNFEEVFHGYCGYDKATRKKRISKKREHLIGLSIHERLVDAVNPNESSKAEFCYFADQHHIYHEVMRKGTIPFFINIQNELFNLFGTAGLELYRKALVTYFSTEQENVLYHDLLASEKGTKAVNTMVDFYLIKDIQEVIVKVLTSKDTTTFTPVEKYFGNEGCLSELVHYFIQNSSDDHKVVLEEQLENHNITLDSLVNGAALQQDTFENHWATLNECVSDIFNQFDFDIERFTLNHKKIVVRQWANEGILTRKDKLTQRIEQFKEKGTFVKKGNKIVISNTPTTQTKVSNSNAYSEFRKSIAASQSFISERILENAKKVKPEDIVFNY